MAVRIRRKKSIPRVEVQSGIWLPEAYRFGNHLESNHIRYAIFGAGALAVHNVMMRPTIDINFVVDDYKKAVELLKSQPNIVSSNLQKDKDGIQVADFHFKSGITIQIWDNNLYSLPMTGDSWSRVIFRQVPGYGTIRSISMEDLIVSKVGRYTQQRKASRYEADKNVKDIIATMQVLSKPDLRYVIQRLKEGARRESRSISSRVHSLDWYFVREVQVYRQTAALMDYDKARTFIAQVLVNSKSASIEYNLLHNVRKSGSASKFQASFMLDKKSYSVLQKRWGSVLKVSGDKVSLSSKDIQNYVRTLESGTLSEYAKKLVYSGKKLYKTGNF